MNMLIMAVVAASAIAGSPNISEPSYTTLISHRGESVDAPENTLSAFKTAVERGFGFECDIYLSKDKRLFTFHDWTLERTTSGANTNACVDVDWAEISKLNVGGWGKWKGSKFDGERPALLEEVLALQRPERKIYVEVKGDNPDWVPYIKEVFAKSKASPDKVLFISFGSNVCRELKRQMPEFKTYWLTWSRKKLATGQIVDHNPKDLIDHMKSLGVDGLDIHFDPKRITPDFVKSIKDAGFEFHVWTVDEIKKTCKAFGAGAQTVTTNRALGLLDEFKKGER
jgi:glycerophosphoryl diester phosphodiesterase